MDADQWHYVDTISKCCSRYPDLLQLRDFLEKEENCGPAVPRAAVLEFRDGKVERKNFDNAEKLHSYFQGSKDPGCKGRLFMLEDLSKPYVEAFGSHFWIDPFLFASQERANWVSWDNPSLGMTYRLPSAQIQDSIFTLRYYEMGRFEGEEDLPNNMKCHSNLDRVIDKEKFAEDRVFSVKRNASFWSRRDKDGWNVLLLLEPPVGETIRFKDKGEEVWKSKEMPNKPYQGGFVDFSPWPEKKADLFSNDKIKEPPRSSMLDDIAYYWTEVASLNQITAAVNEPSETALYLKRIVASSWNILLEYIWKTLNKLDKSLGSFEKPQGKDRKLLDNLAQALANANLWRRRLSWYSDALELNLQSLGISADLEISRVSRNADAHDKVDFLAILQRWRNCGKRLESLIQVLIGTLSVLQGRLSIEGAQLVSALTVLGVIFIPLSYSTNILSLGGDFRPGRAKFWVYFAVALPMLCLVLIFAAATFWCLRRRSQKSQQSNPRRLDKSLGDPSVVGKRHHILAKFSKTMDSDGQAPKTPSRIQRKDAEMC